MRNEKRLKSYNNREKNVETYTYEKSVLLENRQ
jgi:hypothetical protein